jgi:hypothetical protein
MSRTTEEQLYEAALLIKHDPRFGAYRDWLAKNFEQESSRCRKELNDVVMRRAQGAAEAWEKSKDLIERAPELLEKVRGRS